jgi:hypothetical protein
MPHQEMNLPKIPPNCPYFSECDEGPGEPRSVWVHLRGADETHISGGKKTKKAQRIDECLCHASVSMRPVIAAMAEVYCRKEFERLSAIEPEGTRAKIANQKERKKWAEAVRQWRIWCEEGK